MSPLLSWIELNWLSLLQGAGIVSGLFFTALSIRRDTKSRKISDLLTLASHHRELWEELNEKPGLDRILATEVDLVSAPITPREEAFLNRVIQHFNTSWLIAREGALLTATALAADVSWFFSLPIPRRVWEQTKEGRDWRFVKFIEKARRKKAV